MTKVAPSKISGDVVIVDMAAPDTAGAVALGLAQPVAYLIFFTPFLKAVMASQGVSTYGDAHQIYVPGLFTAMGLFGGQYLGPRCPLLPIVNRLSAALRIADDGGHGHDPASRHVHRGRQAV